MVVLPALTTTQGSSLSGRYSPGTPPAQRLWIPGTSTRLLRVIAGFGLSIRTSTLDVERPVLRLASRAKRLRQRLCGVSRFHRRRAGLLVRCSHRRDPHIPRHRETGDLNPACTATAFDQMRGLQGDRTPVFHLPTSPLPGGLIDDINSR